MSTKILHRAVLGAVLVLPVLTLVSSLAQADPGESTEDEQSTELAATTAHAVRASNRDTDIAPTVGETYPRGRTHSPLTPAVVRHLRSVAARGDQREHVFAKVGASATVNRNFLRCFAGDHVQLAGREHLQDTIDFFDDGRPNPFRRVSESATVGWHAGRAIYGNPPPLVGEIRAIHPRFGVVMYGTNDIEMNRPLRYAEHMLRLTRMMTVRGVIPILSTIMPRDDDPEADRVVRFYNAVIRGIAQSRNLPMVDFHRELRRLPDHGLAVDRLHPNVYFRHGDPRGCVFTEEGLTHGYNVRNLVTLEALDRVRSVVVEGDDAPDRPVAPPRGAGSLDDALQIGALPFAHAGDTTRSSHRQIDRYPGCEATQDESGAEYVYRLHLEEPARVRALVADEGSVDVDLHLLDGDPETPTCVERSDSMLELELSAGDHAFVVDTFTDHRGREHAGRFLFVVARVDRPSDPHPR